MIFVVPTGKLDPLSKPAVCVNVAIEQLSVAVGSVQVTSASQPDIISTVISSSITSSIAVITGNVSSVTVTLKLLDFSFDFLSITVHTIVFIPGAIKTPSNVVFDSESPGATPFIV